MHESLLEWLAFLGINLTNDALVVMVGFFSALAGFGIAKVLGNRATERSQVELLEKQKQDQALLDDQLDQLNHSFNTLSQEALRNNN